MWAIKGLCVCVCVGLKGCVTFGFHNSTVYQHVVTWADVTVGPSAMKTHSVSWVGDQLRLSHYTLMCYSCRAVRCFGFTASPNVIHNQLDIVRVCNYRDLSTKQNDVAPHVDRQSKSLKPCYHPEFTEWMRGCEVVQYQNRQSGYFSTSSRRVTQLIDSNRLMPPLSSRSSSG